MLQIPECYGYKHDEEGHLVIDEEKAKNVKLIFDLYLNGQSVVGIIKELEKHTDTILSFPNRGPWGGFQIPGELLRLDSGLFHQQIPCGERG